MDKALFLDRDGVVNTEKNYVFRIENFGFITGIFDLCSRARELGFRLFIITNQAGIARGYYTTADYETLTAWMLDEFSSRDIHIEHVYYCPFHATAGIGKYRQDSFDRKPNPGMILRAKAAFNLDLPGSVLIGDKDSDIEAGQTAGIGHNVLLTPDMADTGSPGELRFSSLADIAAWLNRTFSQADRDA
jgi:D-glycero-D-manno-heptose 1,7-bisphosphate phosphatase